MYDFIDQYIYRACKSNNRVHTIKDGKKYIAKYLIPNKYYNAREYRDYYYNADETVPMTIFGGAFIVTLLAMLCLIPHILGVIAFTLINLIITFKIIKGNRYNGIICGSIWLCLFLLAIFILHFIFINSDDPGVIICNKAFHTLFPEYLFKFKFKWLL